MSADTNKRNVDEAPGSGRSVDPTSGLDIDAQQVDHLLISLLIWTLIERKLKKHVEQTERPITGWDNKPTNTPTALMITRKFNNITIIRIGPKRRLNRPLKPVQLEWLEALGLKPDIFTAGPRAG
jgi:hypothetical protein